MYTDCTNVHVNEKKKCICFVCADSGEDILYFARTKKHEGVKGAFNEAEKLLNILACISLLSGIRKTIGKNIQAGIFTMTSLYNRFNVYKLIQ